MGKEDKLSELLSGKTKDVCEFCSFFERDMNDPQGVGGTCGKDGEFCFCFEYCNNFLLTNNEKNNKLVCPVCGENIEYQEEYKLVSCHNLCFEKIPKKYFKCPICKQGELNISCFHANEEHKKCNKCNFEISVDGLITLIINEKEK